MHLVSHRIGRSSGRENRFHPTDLKALFSSNLVGKYLSTHSFEMNKTTSEISKWLAGAGWGCFSLPSSTPPWKQVLAAAV